MGRYLYVKEHSYLCLVHFLVLGKKGRGPREDTPCVGVRGRNMAAEHAFVNRKG